jgi:Tol biopolymer transport system component
MRVWIAVAVGVVVIALGGTAAWLLLGGDEVASTPPSSTGRRLPANGELVFARGRWDGQNRNTWRVFSTDGESTPSRYVSGTYDDPYVVPSPNGSRVAYTQPHRGRFPGSADLWILERATNEARRVTSGGGHESPASWSPDGGRLLVHVDTGIETEEMHAIRFDGSEDLALMLPTRGPFTRAFWTGNERIVGTVGTIFGSPGSLYAFDFETAETTQLVETMKRRLASRPSSGGEILEIDDAGGRPASERIWVVRLDGRGRPRLLATIPRGHFAGAAWSPDGQRVALAAEFGDAEIRMVVLPRAGRVVELGPDSGVDGSAPVWSPDGSKLAYVAGPYLSGDLWLADANGEHGRQLTSTREAEYPIAWLAAPETR